MKKSLLPFFVLLLISSAAAAQVSLGLRGGLNLSNQKAEDPGDIKPGFFVGAYLTGNLSENLAVQPELYYSAMGTRDGDNKYNINYVAIPLLLRFNFNEMVNIHLGPQFGILASAKYKTDAGEMDTKDHFKDLDVGGTLGLGLDFGPFNAGLRYYMGFADINDYVPPVPIPGYEKTKISNSAIQLFLGFRIVGGD